MTCEEKGGSFSSNAKWKNFLGKYEAIIDRYVAVTDKLKENPADVLLAAEYTAILLEMEIWNKKADDFQKRLDNKDFSEYLSELLRITAKIM